MIIGKQFHFDAAHFLPNHPTCGQVHGHTWKVDVELEGPINSQGFVFDFGVLNEIMKGILKQLDHTSLNIFITTPTCEVIASWIGAALEGKFKFFLAGPKVFAVTVQEGDGGYAIYQPRESN